MLIFAGIVIGLIIAGLIVVELYIALQGDAVIEFATAARTEATLEKREAERLYFAVKVPFKNTGRQEGTILDAYLRIYLPQEQYDGLRLRGKVNLEGVLRDDDYFEALLVPAGSSNSLLLRFEASPKAGLSLEEALGGAPDIDIALYADCRGRRELYTIKRYLTLSAVELKALATGGAEQR